MLKDMHLDLQRGTVIAFDSGTILRYRTRWDFQRCEFTPTKTRNSILKDLSLHPCQLRILSIKS